MPKCRASIFIIHFNLKMDSRFSVYVRVRPMIKEDLGLFKKISQSPEVCTKCHDDNTRLYLVKPYFDDREFIFDKVISPELTQPDVFDLVGRNVVDEVINGYNGTMIAYGQTGTGKTFTVF